MKITLDISPPAPRPIYSFDSHYNSPANLMPHEPLSMPLEMPLPDRPWYKRLWTWLKAWVDDVFYEWD